MAQPRTTNRRCPGRWRAHQVERIWERHEVLVSTDPDYEYVINELPSGGTGGLVWRPHVHTQPQAQAVTTIEHNLGRMGPVNVSVFSIDGQTEYFNFYTEMMTANLCRISFDDPIAFVATVF